jgi:dTDP-4-amino-4,6-dideoxygalactose transaminase
MFYRLPPAGEPISLAVGRRPVESAGYLFDSFSARFYGSGTQALAAAVLATLESKPTQNPEVLIPAYTCPAVVSAVLYAGAKPRLVDFEQDRPWMNLAQLESMISKRTVAIIAVHLFGIPERLSRIREIARSAGLVVIEDSAQRIPEPDEDCFYGDFVVLSFGRGKPLSLLCGGAVLVSDKKRMACLPDPNPATAGTVGRIWLHVKLSLYNRFLSPRLYWLPASIPFLQLGETRFIPLDYIRGMDQRLLDRLPLALVEHRQRSETIQQKITHMLSQLGSVDMVDLPATCGQGRSPHLSRYPVLVLPVGLRDRVFKKLDRAGLGPSKMYPASLPQIQGLSEILGTQGPFPSTERFSRTILTLPTHSGVTSEHVASMRKIFLKTLNVA